MHHALQCYYALVVKLRLWLLIVSNTISRSGTQCLLLMCYVEGLLTALSHSLATSLHQHHHYYQHYHHHEDRLVHVTTVNCWTVLQVTTVFTLQRLTNSLY